MIDTLSIYRFDLKGFFEFILDFLLKISVHIPFLDPTFFRTKIMINFFKNLIYVTHQIYDLKFDLLTFI